MAALSYFVCLQRKRRPWLLIGWAWFLVTLLPVIGLVKVGSHLIADRYTYLPSIGIFIMLAWSLAEFVQWSEGRRRVIVTATAIVLAASAMAASSQVRYWRNTETLFRHALSVTTSNYIAYTSLAFDLAEHKQMKEAEECLRASLAVNPAVDEAWIEMAIWFVEQGRLDE